MRKRSARFGTLGGVVVIAAAAAAIAVANTITGPSSSDPPYVIRSQPGVVTKSILTVGDSVGGYRMVGIPDGLGAFDNGDGTFTVLMNHELGATVGTVRAHGAKGAFVSKWTIAKESLEVLAGEDLIQQIATWNGAIGSYNAPAKGIALSRRALPTCRTAPPSTTRRPAWATTAGCSWTGRSRGRRAARSRTR